MKWRMVSAWMALMLLVTAAVPALAEESAPAVMTAGEQFTDGRTGAFLYAELTKSS